MKIDLNLTWRSAPPAIAACALGSVQSVINSQAGKLAGVPPIISHGLGALTTTGAAGTGEGIVFRGRTAVTPAIAEAGVQFHYQAMPENVESPFCVGWQGEPAAVGSFTCPEAATLLEVFTAVFEQVQAQPEDREAAVFFLEIVGLFPASEIHDRALKTPVDKGGVLITAPEHAARYFKSRIIQQDLAARGQPADSLIPLAVAGVGFNPGADAPPLRQFQQVVFYAPPQLGGAPAGPAAGLKTHSHAMGWRGQAQLTHNLVQVSDPAALQELEASTLPRILQSPPDYVVHLDDWSRLTRGMVRVFVLGALEQLTFVAV